MSKKVYSKAEKRSWLNGLRLGELRAGKKSAPKKNGLGYSNNNSSFNVDEFYEKALNRTAARTTKSAPKKKKHAQKSTYKQVKKPAVKKKPIYDYTEDFDWTSSGRIKGAYVDGKFEPD